MPDEYRQMTLFDFLIVEQNHNYKIKKPVRLIELFAGIGAQAKALERLGVDYEPWVVCEFDKYAIESYNAVHGTNFETSDICKLHGSDLRIADKEHFTYLLTYSFPCTDLSVAGRQAGMSKGSGTRSGLLWEVERLLNETEELPDVLLMENVKQVIGKKNKDDFDLWCDFLTNKGYRNFLQVMNAADYGVPQHRERAFMVSILGDYEYTFPKPIELTKTVEDVLIDEVDSKYYVKTDKAKQLIERLIDSGAIHETKPIIVPKGILETDAEKDDKGGEIHS